MPQNYREEKKRNDGQDLWAKEKEKERQRAVSRAPASRLAASPQLFATAGAAVPLPHRLTGRSDWPVCS
jgi:hypothetical protein